MAAAAHNPSFARKVGIPVSVAKDFNNADQGKHMKKGGHMKSMKPKLPAALADQAAAPPPNAAAGPITGGGDMPQMKKGGKVNKFKEGGETVAGEQGHKKEWPLKGEDKDHHGKKVAMKKGGRAKHFAKGGSVRGDGIAERGHTRGSFR